MEPVKGGTLAQLPVEAENTLREMHPDWSPAQWALRFVQSLPEVEICLSGMHDGGVAERTKNFMDSIGKRADYINTIKMHDNAIIVFDMDQQRTVEESKKVDEHIALLKRDIKECKTEIQFAEEEEIQFQASYKKMVEKNGPSYTFPLYRVTEKCVGCGTCTKVCPRGCITLQDNKPSYNYAKCINCMACAQACPKKAIKLVVHEPNPEARYRNVHITLNELIQANNQN